MNIFKKVLYVLSKKQRGNLIFLFIFIFIGAIMELIGVSIILPFIQVIVSPEIILENKNLKWIYYFLEMKSSKEMLICLTIAIIIIYIVKNIYLYFMFSMQFRFANNRQKDLGTRLMGIYMKQPYTFFLNRNTATLMRNMTVDIDRFFIAVTNLIKLCSEVLVAVLLGVFVFLTDASITLVIAALLVITVLISMKVFKKISKKLGTENRKYSENTAKTMMQAFNGIKEIKVLNRDDFFTEEYEKNYNLYAQGQRKYQLLGETPRLCVESVCIVGMMISILFKIVSGEDLSLFIPKLSVFAIVAFRLLPSANRINNYMNTINFCAPSVSSIYDEIIDLEKLESKIIIGQSTDNKIDKLDFNYEIGVEHIFYKYPGTENYVLQDVSFSIPKGKAVAFIGASGAGKTTMADLILGVLTPNSGTVLSDGKDVNSNIHAWYNNIGYIPQEIYLIDDTIRNNIALGIPVQEIDEAKIQRAVEQAQLKQFMSEIDNGLDTVIGERGVRLSGGQRQRIGIARALYHNPQILVLDEATSALDTDTETAVMDAIDSLHGTKTIIIIAHRLSTIKSCDLVYEVIKGSVNPIQ